MRSPPPSGLRFTLLTSLLFVAPGAAWAADDAGTKPASLHVAVASQATDKCNLDLGYAVGPDARAAESEVKKQHPRAQHFFHADNFKKKKPQGRYLVVVSTQGKNEKCTPGLHLGVGFGTDEKSATRAALENLGKRYPWWSKKDEGFQVERSEAL